VYSGTLAQARRSYLEPAVNRYRWVVLARACVIVALGGFEAIHIGTRPYLQVGIGIVLVSVGVGAYAFTKARDLRS
jgi:hypothetical protein